MANIWCFCFALFGLFLTPVWPKQDVSRTFLKCADPVCEQIIAKGRTTQKYQPYEDNVLSCKPNDEVQIFGKILDSPRKLWRVKIGSEIGFFPKRYIKESEVFIQDRQLNFEVPVGPKNQILLENSESFSNQEAVPEKSAETSSAESGEEEISDKSKDSSSIPESEVLLEMIPNLQPTNVPSVSPDTTESNQDPQSNTLPTMSTQVGETEKTVYSTPTVEQLPATASINLDNAQSTYAESHNHPTESSQHDESIGNIIEAQPSSLYSQNLPSHHTQLTQNANSDLKQPDQEQPEVNQPTPIQPQMQQNMNTQYLAQSDTTQQQFTNFQSEPNTNIPYNHVETPQNFQGTADHANFESNHPSQHNSIEDGLLTTSFHIEVETTAPTHSSGFQSETILGTPEVINSKDNGNISPVTSAILESDPPSDQSAAVNISPSELPAIETSSVASSDQESISSTSQSETVQPVTVQESTMVDGTLIPVTDEPELNHLASDHFGNLQTSQQESASVLSTEHTPSLPPSPSIVDYIVPIESLNVESTKVLQTPNLDTSDSKATESFLSDKEDSTNSFAEPKDSSILREVEEKVEPMSAGGPLKEDNTDKTPNTEDVGTVTENGQVEANNVVGIQAENPKLFHLTENFNPVEETLKNHDQPNPNMENLNDVENTSPFAATDFIQQTSESNGHHDSPGNSLQTETTADIPYTDQPSNNEKSEILNEQPTDTPSKYDVDPLTLSNLESPLSETVSPETEELPLDSADSTPSYSSSLLENLFENLAPLFGTDLSAALDSTSQQLSSGTSILLSIIALTIVTAYTIHLIMIKMSREAPLLSAMNDLQREMRMTKQKNIELQGKHASNNGQPPMTMTNPKDAVKLQAAQNQIQSNKEHYEKLLTENQHKIQNLEQELEESTANGMEMHKMLNELLSSQKDASNFQASVDHLQKMLDGQREKVESLTSDLALKTRLNDELRIELKTTKQKTSKLEYQIEQLSHSLEETSAAKHDALKKVEAETSNLSSLENTRTALHKELHDKNSLAESLANQVETLQSSLKKAKTALNGKQAELQVSKECLKKLQGVSLKDKKLPELFNIIEVKSQLLASQKERETVMKELSESVSKQANLESKLSTVEQELKGLRNNEAQAMKERDDAVSKLEVLSKYFKEKEEELTKELESTEYLRLDAEGSVSSTANKLQSYQEELLTCRSQIEELKVEMDEQKKSYKMQLTNEEKKAHDNWLAARTAERRQEELRQENGQLRQRLTLMVRDSDGSILKPHIKRTETNGNISSPGSTDGDLDRSHSSPLSLDPSHMPPMPPMLPPPPMFPGGPMPPMGLPPPPPPPPHMMGPFPHPPPDRRLPPAGRIASPSFRRQGSPPPYDRRSYSPSSDHSHYSDRRYSPHNTSRYSPNGQRRLPSPDRRSDRSRHRYDPLSDHMSSPISRDNRMSPDRWFSRSPEGLKPTKNYFYKDENNEDRRHKPGQKTSTPNQR